MIKIEVQEGTVIEADVDGTGGELIADLSTIFATILGAITEDTTEQIKILNEFTELYKKATRVINEVFEDER